MALKKTLNIQKYTDIQARKYFDWALLPLCCCPNRAPKDKEALPKFGILLVAYGSSSYQGSSALRFFQLRMEQYFNVPVRIAFTSETMRKRLAHAKTKSDSVLKALQKMNFEKFSHVAVQSLHLIHGIEYFDVLGDIDIAKKSMNMQIEAGLPLLSHDDEIAPVAKALLSLIPENFTECDKLLWMGHGTSHEAERYYDLIAETVHSLDARLSIACMTGTNTLDTVLEKWKQELSTSKDVSMNNSCKGKVWLLPLLTVIGRHALHDMAGEQEDSWKSLLEQAGYACEPHLHGLAESEMIQDIWIERLCSALKRF